MRIRTGSGVVAALLLVSTTALPLAATPSRQMNCAALIDAGAVACDVRESWISGNTFPATQQHPWPPAGYRLVDRALLNQTATQEFCVVPIRTLQRERDAQYGEPNDLLPPLHEGFETCLSDQVMRPGTADYVAVVRRIRELLPRPSFSIQPEGNTIVGIRTDLDIAPRAMQIDTETVVELNQVATPVRIEAAGVYYTVWNDVHETTGPYTPQVAAPAHVYLASGVQHVDVFDVWTVRVTAPGVPPFHDLVYLGYPGVAVRVNELVIRVLPTVGSP